MFARTGIYLFNEDSPRWAYQAYASAVWFGNTMFNFAAILSLLLLALAAGYLWTRRQAFRDTGNPSSDERARLTQEIGCYQDLFDTH